MTTNAAMLLIQIWIAVESGGNNFAINGDGVGCLQQRVMFLADINRQLGYVKYYPQGRYDRQTSIEAAMDWIRLQGISDPKELTARYYAGNIGAKHPGPLCRNHVRKVMKLLKQQGGKR